MKMPFVIHSLDLHLFSAGNVESHINLHSYFCFSFSVFGSSGAINGTNHVNLLCPLLLRSMSSTTELSHPRCTSNKPPPPSPRNSILPHFVPSLFILSLVMETSQPCLIFVRREPIFREVLLVFLISQRPHL